MTAGLAAGDPFTWWRTPCFATDRIALCGDLDTHRSAKGRQQLDGWIDLGITDIVDVREEWNDEDFVRRHAPHVSYHWMGTDDDGRGQPDEWFAGGVSAATKALLDPERKVMVHCHMGVNRGPSMGYAIMLAHGFEPINALTAIRAARPIAAIIYADDAVSWWHRTNGASPDTVKSEVRRVKEWLRANRVDDGWVASRIRQVDSRA
jgi:rhodanese-related sulfurtransferase